jgi:hypothetical protein
MAQHLTSAARFDFQPCLEAGPTSAPATHAPGPPVVPSMEISPRRRRDLGLYTLLSHINFDTARLSSLSHPPRLALAATVQPLIRSSNRREPFPPGTPSPGPSPSYSLVSASPSPVQHAVRSSVCHRGE